MICSGCGAPDEYVSNETGLCWRCATPESKALVPAGAVALMASPEVTTLYQALPPKAQAFLQAYMEDTTILGAADIVGISRTSHYNWLENTSGYRKVFEVAKRVVVDQWHRHFVDKVRNGLKEVMLDADGNLKHTRIREDAALLKMHMMAVYPEMYNPDKSSDNNVTIVLRSVNEGGWGDEEDQQPREILRNEGGKVTYPDDGEGGWSSTRTAKTSESDSIPKPEVIESVETGTGEEEAPCAPEEISASDEAPVEERSRRGGPTWRQEQHHADWYSTLPNDD